MIAATEIGIARELPQYELAWGVYCDEVWPPWALAAAEKAMRLARQHLISKHGDVEVVRCQSQCRRVDDLRSSCDCRFALIWTEWLRPVGGPLDV